VGGVMSTVVAAVDRTTMERVSCSPRCSAMSTSSSACAERALVRFTFTAAGSTHMSTETEPSTATRKLVASILISDFTAAALMIEGGREQTSVETLTLLTYT
jgi:hypothetical protein